MQSCHTNSRYVAQFSARRRASLAYFGGCVHDTIDCIDSATGYESIRSKHRYLPYTAEVAISLQGREHLHVSV